MLATIRPVHTAIITICVLLNASFGVSCIMRAKVRSGRSPSIVKILSNIARSVFHNSLPWRDQNYPNVPLQKILSRCRAPCPDRDRHLRHAAGRRQAAENEPQGAPETYQSRRPDEDDGCL